MSSLQTRFAQRDNRLETITLTGYITNNGLIDSVNNVPPQHPAYAEINLTKAQNFLIDTRNLTLRTGGTGIQYLLRIYISPTSPPLYYQNFEWTIFVQLPQTSINWIGIEVFNSSGGSVNNPVVHTHNGVIYRINVYRDYTLAY